MNRASKPAERQEEDRILEAKLQACLRSVFHKYVCTLMLKVFPSL